MARISRNVDCRCRPRRAALRPDTPGRERPPSDQGVGSGLRFEEGVAHAPVLTSIVRAAAAAAQSAADVWTIGHLHVRVAERVADSDIYSCDSSCRSTSRATRQSRGAD